MRAIKLYPFDEAPKDLKSLDPYKGMANYATVWIMVGEEREYKTRYGYKQTLEERMEICFTNRADSTKIALTDGTVAYYIASYT